MAVICGGDVYINHMTETFPVLEKVARFSKLSATNIFFFHSFGKTHAWDIFSTWIICEKCFLNFYCFKQFFFKNIFRTLVAFLSCYLAVPRPTLGHYWMDSLPLLMLITAFLQFWLECQGSLERGWVPKPHRAPLGFEPVTHRF